MLIKLLLWVRVLLNRHHYYFLSWQPLSPWWILSNGPFGAVLIHPHFSVFFLLFLQLLHGALVREHWGDGCKYLIVGDFLAAGRVPHFRRSRDTSVLATHQVLIQIHRFMQYVVWVFCNRAPPPFLFSRTVRNNIYVKCSKRKSIKPQHNFSMRRSFVLG